MLEVAAKGPSAAAFTAPSPVATGEIGPLPVDLVIRGGPCR